MEFLTSKETDLLENKVVFSLFICCPEALPYTSKISWIVWMSLIWARQNSKLSSAKNKWEILGPYRQREYPLILSSFIAFWIRALKPSEHRRKRYGDKGSPCRIPLVGEMFPLGSPLISMEYETVLIHFKIIFIHLLSNPIFPLTSTKRPTPLYHKPCSCQA